MADLRELIEKLEKLDGPDREFDADLDVALFGGETVWKQANYTMESYPASRRPSKHHVGGFANEHVPPYTASLDSAVALVERMKPGWIWDVTSTGTAWMLDPDNNGDIYTATEAKPTLTEAQRRPATPAIALCLALLRALSAEEG